MQQPRTFYLQVPVGEGIQISYPFKLKEGDSTGEGNLYSSSQGDQAKGAPRGDAQVVGHCMQTPFLNPNPFHWLYGINNVAKVRINRESCMTLLDNGAQINTIMLSFVEDCSFDVGPLSDLVCRWVTRVGRGNVLTQPLGYVVMWVQVDGVQSYESGPNSPGDPGFVKFCSTGSCYLGHSYNKSCHKCD